MEPIARHLPAPLDHEVTGQLADIYEGYKAQTGQPAMPGILRCFAARPDVLELFIAMATKLHFTDGHLDRRRKEMIATYVSGLNHCPY